MAEILRPAAPTARFSSGTWPRSQTLWRRISADRRAEPTTDHLARPSRNHRNRITKTPKLEIAKENSGVLFRVFSISCFRDGVGFVAREKTLFLIRDIRAIRGWISFQLFFFTDAASGA